MASAQPRPDPAPAYVASPGSVLHANRSLYESIAATAHTPGGRERIEHFILPIRSGKAWAVPAGCVCRISTPEGPQVGDLNIWNLHNSRERFWASRTRQLESSHVTTFNRLWSNLPYLRPLVTITADTLADYGVDEDGGRVHDLLGTRCDPYVRELLQSTGNSVTEPGDGHQYNFHCHSNLTRAVLPYGLSESDVHDVLNVFQVTGLNSAGRYFMKTCPAKAGDYIEFFAEIDILCALSTCPGGDLSRWAWSDEAGDDTMLDCCRPLGVEVFQIIDPQVLKSWKRPESPAYKGLHGIAVPLGEGPRGN